jgi:hypothetical protein
MPKCYIYCVYIHIYIEVYFPIECSEEWQGDGRHGGTGREEEGSKAGRAGGSHAAHTSSHGAGRYVRPGRGGQGRPAFHGLLSMISRLATGNPTWKICFLGLSGLRSWEKALSNSAPS